VLVSLLFLVPPIVWNWQHDWITLRHTADELEASPFRWRRSAKFVLEFVGGQAALGGGISWVLMAGAAAGSLARWRSLAARERFLLMFSVPGIAAYGALSLHQRVEQNWPLVFYPALAVLLAGRVCSGPEGGGWRRWTKVGVGLGACLGLLLMLVPFVAPRTAWAGSKSDPTARVRGWRRLADEVAKVRTAVPRPERTFLLAPRDRYVASALAFYLPDRPRTYCWEDAKHPESQYGIWGLPEGLAGWDALVFEPSADLPRIPELARRFDTWEPRGELVIPLGSDTARHRRYFVFLGRGFRPSEGGPKMGAGGAE
ncbi:MAG: hypothetical protein JNL97_05585, partial [Verrucomicrobiales bacterium]|nr:hypothetical protein [Verrucomicrobiales bacterium]